MDGAFTGALSCAWRDCSRPLDWPNIVVFEVDGSTHLFHPVCARAVASELGALALVAVNRARVDGLATRVDAMERRWAEKRQISKTEWHRRVREALGIGYGDS